MALKRKRPLSGPSDAYLRAGHLGANLLAPLSAYPPIRVGPRVSRVGLAIRTPFHPAICQEI